MARNKIELPLKDATDPAIADELRATGGKVQVPALLHDGEILYESSDIRDWLDAQL
ncbi:MAG: glutathione S-transferase N-terminal domain-containing protein [Actinomycetia bacterium]|nr:glutathione S-transferase N-terminal domain-containing protein [Actinomycetes bacterium]